MTKKQRAQVVELLRCAADTWRMRPGMLSNGELRGVLMMYGEEARDAAVDAWQTVPGISAETLLEAAARVEEESYP